MQSAFLLRGIFPPPAAGAKIFAGLDGAGTRGTADADKALVVQRIDGDTMGAGVVAHFVERPVKQGVEFDKATICIPFKRTHVAAVGRLLGADASDPKLSLL